MIRTMSAFLATMTLVACNDGKPLPAIFGSPAGVTRAYADIFQDKPFDTASISVLAPQGDELQTFTLRPCGSGTQICGATTGTLEQTLDHYIVTGAYPGRTFHLSPGGDGFMRTASGDTNIAWN
jgi:hypothetical protein